MPPPAGIGRIHRIADDEAETPAQADRFREYVRLIRDEMFSANAIAKRLSFRIDINALRSDLAELVERGAIVTIHRKGVTLYSLRDQQANPLVTARSATRPGGG